MITVIGGLFAVMLVFNLATGGSSFPLQDSRLHIHNISGIFWDFTPLASLLSWQADARCANWF